MEIQNISAELLSCKKEGQHFDRKSARIRPKEIAKIISAFANAEGGILAIGIEDNGEITGLKLTRRTEVERHPRTFYSRVFRQRGNWKLEQYRTVLGRKDRGFLTSTIRPARLGIRTVSNSP